jgi:hypothetical protein
VVLAVLTALAALVGAVVVLRRRRSEGSETEAMPDVVVPDGEVASTMGETVRLNY